MTIVKESNGLVIPIRRKTGAFIIEVDVKDESSDGFTGAKKAVKQKVNQSDEMDVDAIVKGAWEAFGNAEMMGNRVFPGRCRLFSTAIKS